MYILTERNSGDYQELHLIPLLEQEGIVLSNESLSFNGDASARVINERVTADEAKARFDDIIRALRSGKVLVYDTRLPVGQQPKSAPKKAPAAQEAPAPKK